MESGRAVEGMGDEAYTRVSVPSCRLTQPAAVLWYKVLWRIIGRMENVESASSVCEARVQFWKQCCAALTVLEYRIRRAMGVIK